MAIPDRNSLTLAPPRITAARFKQLLASKESPALPESDIIYQIFVDSGVEASFALAQFRVESQYGTAGYAKVTGSWGNMLYDPKLCRHAEGKFSPGNGYTYATYTSYANAVMDYCNYIHWYADKYNLYTIYEATARWLGKAPGAPGHVSYVDIIVQDMIMYEYKGKFYEAGDKMIYGGDSFNRDTGKVVTKYPVTYGLTLYRGTDGAILKKFSGTSANAWFLGPVQGSWDWGMVCIGTSVADPDATWCYIKNIDPKKIIRVA